MKKNQQTKPDKKTDRELYDLITSKITSDNYIFLSHAKKRLKDRNISDLDVLDILEGKNDNERTRNKRKDKYEGSCQDWNYCIEGINLDGVKIRVIISFEGNLLLIITVIRFDERGY